MKSEIHFGAPWGQSARIMTWFTLFVLASGSIFALVIFPETMPFSVRVIFLGLPPAIICGTLPFIVRGYALNDGELLIQRLGWCNHVPLRSVVSATPDPTAVSGSARLWGNGGLFGFYGWFWKRQLGTYRAYVTDPKNSVVMKLTDRTIVVTPDDPQRFVMEIDRRRAVAFAS